MSFTLALAAGAIPFADLDTIDRQVARFTGAEIGAQGGAIQPVDRRLRLRRCASSLGLAWRSAQRDTVVIRCGDAGGWRLYVPVQSRALTSGATSASTQPSVNRGDAVTIAAQGRGFTVSRQGEALETGINGAWIRVRPVTAKRFAEDPVRARIVRPGLVSVQLP